MIVLDASAAIELIAVAGPLGDEAARHCLSGVAVPAHFTSEVLSTLRGLERGNVLSTDRMWDAHDSLSELRRATIPLDELTRRALDLRHNATVYDAFYIAAAEALGVPLVAKDAKYAAIPGRRCDVIVLGQHRP